MQLIELRAQYVQVSVQSDTFTVIQIVYSTTYYVLFSTYNVCESEVHTVGPIELYNIESLYNLLNSTHI